MEEDFEEEPDVDLKVRELKSIFVNQKPRVFDTSNPKHWKEVKDPNAKPEPRPRVLT